MAVPEHYPLTLTVIGKAHILSGDLTGLTETLKDDLLDLISRLAIPGMKPPPVIHRRHRTKSSGLNYTCTQILRALGEYNTEVTLGRFGEITERKDSTISSVLTKLIARTMATRMGLGVYRITEKGREYLRANPAPVGPTPPVPEELHE